MLKLQNKLEESDYAKMAERLSDADLISEEDGKIAIRLVQMTPLEPPFQLLGESYEANGVASLNAKEYYIEFNIDYCRGEEEKIREALGDFRSVPLEGYDTKVGQSNLRLRHGASDFAVSLTGRHLIVRMAQEKAISAGALKADINESVSILEGIVNRVYAKLGVGGEFELEGRIRATYPRSRALHARKNKLEEAIKLEKPKVRFEDIGGCMAAKAAFETLAHGLQNPQDYERWGLRYPKGILLHGLPGTGKTMLAKAMAHAAKASLYSVSISDISSMWFGVAEKRINKVFDIAQKNAPSIILFDEIDSIGRQRDYSTSNSSGSRLVSCFLQRMDGIKGNDRVIAIGTTNFIRAVDPALRRPGRFDKIIEVPLPDMKAREMIFRLHCKDRRVAGDIDYRLLAKESDEFTGAEIEGLIQSALEAKLAEELATGNRELKPVSTDDIIAEIREQTKEDVPAGGPRMYA